MQALEFRTLLQAVHPHRSASSWLARRLNVNPRTIRKWVNDEQPVPEWASVELRTMHAALNPSPQALDAFDTAAALMGEHETPWAAVRDNHVVYLLHDGEPVGVGAWDDDRGILSPRLLIDDSLLDELADSVRAAREQH